jgi:hypothetical protein
VAGVLSGGHRRAPFTPAEVSSIDEYQRDPYSVPLVCTVHPGGVPLMATAAGLRCRVCGQVRDTVPAWVADGRWRAL